jgi:hypothetical protein
MELERIMILTFALLYGIWGLLLIGHSLLQMWEKPHEHTTNQNKATKTVSEGVNDSSKVA